jgi:hypothetical protein
MIHCGKGYYYGHGFLFICGVIKSNCRSNCFYLAGENYDGKISMTNTFAFYGRRRRHMSFCEPFK